MEQAQKPFSPKPIDNEAWDIRGALDSIGIGAANVHFRFNFGREEKMLANKNVAKRVSSDPIVLVPFLQLIDSLWQRCAQKL